MQSESPETAPDRWLSRLFAIAVVMTSGLIMAMDYADPDLWGHVLYGQEILAEGVLPRTTTWSFTAEGYRWINHENIAELVMAWTVNHWGPQGLTVGKYLFSLFLIGLIWWMAKAKGVRTEVAAFVCFVAAFSIQFHWHFRPQIFGYVFFGALCVLLNWCLPDRNQSQHPKRLKHLFWLLPLAILWTNTHGSFAAGICVACAYLGLKFVEAAWNYWTASRQQTIPGPSTNLIYLLPVVVCVTCLGTLVNPYGIGLHAWLLEALREPRPEIGDWESPSLFSFSREVIGLWVMLLTTGFATRNSLKTSWPRVVVFALIALQAISHIRHLPLLAILWGTWFSNDLNLLWNSFVQDIKLKTSESELPSRTTPTLSKDWLRGGVCLVWICLVGANTFPKLQTLRVPRELYPVDALNFMAQHQVEGKTVVTFNWAQYAIGFFANEEMDSRVAVDGRFRTCYPQEVIDVYFDFIFGENYAVPRHRSQESGPIDSERALTFNDPEIFLISRKQRSTTRTMREHQVDWVLLYQDQLAEVWGRREKFAQTESDDYLAESERFIGEKTETSAAWPAFSSADEKQGRYSQRLVTTQ